MIGLLIGYVGNLFFCRVVCYLCEVIIKMFYGLEIYMLKILIKYDFIRFSVIEMILLDMELIDIFWIINYVKGFIYISFVCFVYCREELFLI